jgi:hypothetical protein
LVAIGIADKLYWVPLIFTVSVALNPLARLGLSIITKPQAFTGQFLVTVLGYSTFNLVKAGSR